AADDVGCQRGQTIIVALRPAVFDRYVLTLDVAGFAESFAEGGENGCAPVGGKAVQEADHRHRLLLRARRERPGDRRRSTEQCDEIAAFHSMTSSARAKSDCGTVRPSAFAVLRLITSSNLLGCSIGRSAGLAPFSILAVEIPF